MPQNTKIATCSYCGRRQTLDFTARGGHELACGACGAPIHEMKWLKPPEQRVEAKRSPRQPAPHGFALPERPLKSRRKKKRKPMWKRMMKDTFEEACDVIEDIFD